MLTKPANVGMFVLLVLLRIASIARADQAAGIMTTLNDVRFESISSDQLSVDVMVLPRMTPEHLLVRDPALQNILKGLHKGDRLAILVSTENGQAILQSMSVRVVTVGRLFRTVVLRFAIFAFWLVCFLLSGFHPEKLIMGEDGRFSNSKFQTVLWFGVLVSSYLANLVTGSRTGKRHAGGHQHTSKPAAPLRHGAP